MKRASCGRYKRVQQAFEAFVLVIVIGFGIGVILVSIVSEIFT
tara:strand:+ start:1985 stop:2113 length:129 start_codon:yes stop_codon:yes gene_type:complete